MNSFEKKLFLGEHLTREDLHEYMHSIVDEDEKIKAIKRCLFFAFEGIRRFNGRIYWKDMDIDAITLEKNKLSVENSDLRKRNTELESRIAELETRIAKLEDENEMHKSLWLKAEEEIKKAKGQVKYWIEQYRNLFAKIVSMNTRGGKR